MYTTMLILLSPYIRLPCLRIGMRVGMRVGMRNVVWMDVRDGMGMSCIVMQWLIGLQIIGIL
jgi:hypothetical protein